MRRNQLTVLLAGLLLVACGKADFFSEDKAIANQEWNAKDTVSFNVEVSDTTGFYDFFIDFRHNDNYAYNDIYFFFDIGAPNGQSVHDTIHCIMQSPDGKWLGKSSGSIIQNHVLIKTKTGFPVKGKYKMQIRHAMRDEKLQGIEDVGLSITQKD